MPQYQWKCLILILVVTFADKGISDTVNTTNNTLKPEVDYSQPPDLKNGTIFYSQLHTLVPHMTQMGKPGEPNVMLVDVGSQCDLSLNEGQAFGYLNYSVAMGPDYSHRHRQALLGPYNTIAAVFWKRTQEEGVTRVCPFNVKSPAEERLVCASMKNGTEVVSRCIKCNDEASLTASEHGNLLRETTCKFTGFRTMERKSSDGGITSRLSYFVLGGCVLLSHVW